MNHHTSPSNLKLEGDNARTIEMEKDWLRTGKAIFWGSRLNINVNYSFICNIYVASGSSKHVLVFHFG